MDVINTAIRNHEMICVWGDFDVDGQTSTALLVQTLRMVSANELRGYKLTYAPELLRHFTARFEPL